MSLWQNAVKNAEIRKTFVHKHTHTLELEKEWEKVFGYE